MNRRVDLDALRVILCFAVIFQHAVLIFAAEPRYHLKTAAPVEWATVLYEFLRIFAMPPFFAIAGWAAVVSLRSRTPSDFLRERAKRLLPPLVMGVIVFGPIIKFIELKSGRDMSLAGFQLVDPLTIGFLEFLPRYWTRSILMTWSHLWFLMYLMVISLLLLPVLVWAARQEPVLQKASRISVFLPAAILGTALFSLGGYWPYLPNLIQDGANLFYFALCFLAGGMMAVWPGYEERLREQKWLLLLMGGLGFWGVEAWGPSALGRVAVGVTAWGLLGFAWAASSWLRPRPTPRWNKIVEGTFPIYVVHHVPLLLLAVAFLPLPLSTALEIVVITASTVGISWLIYSWAIRPCPPLRWMFGLGKMVASSRNPACEATVARGD